MKVKSWFSPIAAALVIAVVGFSSPAQAATQTYFVNYDYIYYDTCQVSIGTNPAAGGANVTSRLGDPKHLNTIYAASKTSSTLFVQVSVKADGRIITYTVPGWERFDRTIGYGIYRWRVSTIGPFDTERTYSGWVKPASDNPCYPVQG